MDRMDTVQKKSHKLNNHLESSMVEVNSLKIKVLEIKEGGNHLYEIEAVVQQLSSVLAKVKRSFNEVQLWNMSVKNENKEVMDCISRGGQLNSFGIGCLTDSETFESFSKKNLNKKTFVAFFRISSHQENLENHGSEFTNLALQSILLTARKIFSSENLKSIDIYQVSPFEFLLHIDSECIALTEVVRNLLLINSAIGKIKYFSRDSKEDISTISLIYSIASTGVLPLEMLIEELKELNAELDEKNLINYLDDIET